jgi:drug/metabolite transporter (DMT)-like permease
MSPGELAAFGTAACWTVTVMAFEAAGRRIGSLPVNILRLLLGLLFLTVWTTATGGRLLPTDAPLSTWLWMGLSGLVGFVLGDLCLFRAFVLIGGRVTMILYSLVPPMSALAGWLLLGENLPPVVWLAMAVTLAGVCMVILVKGDGRMVLAHPVRGILLALAGSLGQALGLVISKHGMGDLGMFQATQIRILAATAAFLILIPLLRQTGRIRGALRNRRAMGIVLLGSFFGPFLGVSLSLAAIRGMEIGVAATIMSMVPVFILLPEVLFLKKRIRPLEVVGAFIAVGGIALLTL